MAGAAWYHCQPGNGSIGGGRYDDESGKQVLEYRFVADPPQFHAPTSPASSTSLSPDCTPGQQVASFIQEFSTHRSHRRP
ncbi:hypothetical protein Hypma_014586 [Hypsizygus marmoreus]|uniref:Uncharacterized protein n=1 Tax=Hypsizygus marmoreus TaxID=39966 RepID=A0A369JHL4_HYPMA|nr:hypothetical protein Hypma_014586 [Hypsizygus marmoreus]